MIFALPITAGALAITVRAAAKWRDRTTGDTVWGLLTGALLLAVPIAALSRSGTATYLWLAAVVGAGSIAGLVNVLVTRRDRKRAWLMALSTGVSPWLAWELYRGPGVSPHRLIGMYMIGALSWVLLVVGVAHMSSASLLDVHRLHDAHADPRVQDLPWWILVAVAIESVGLLHAVSRATRAAKTEVPNHSAVPNDSHPQEH